MVLIRGSQHKSQFGFCDEVKYLGIFLDLPWNTLHTSLKEIDENCSSIMEVPNLFEISLEAKTEDELLDLFESNHVCATNIVAKK